MTPALASFTATGDDRQTGEDCVRAALAALAAEFTLDDERGREPADGPGGVERAAVRRRTWLDTFDWRLHQAGLTLDYVAGSRGGELRLAPAGQPDGTRGDAVTVQPVTGWRPSRPSLLSDLPDGPVTARLAPIIAPRALLPLATTVATATVGRLLNEDKKTVARLTIERTVIAGPDAVPLAPRLSVTEVRGYPGQAARASRLIAALPGFTREPERPFTAALHAIGRHPGDYSGRVEAAITPGMPASRAAASILLCLLDTIEANVAGVIRDTDTEFLHDLRVSVRRTRSALKLFGDVLGLPAGDLAFFAAEFKWVGDVTTPVRDLDVHLLDFPTMARSLAAARPDDLEPFRSYLERRRRREFRALTRALRSPRFGRAMRSWRDALTAVEQAHPGAPGAGPVRSGPMAAAPPAVGTVGTLAAERTRVCFVKVARHGAQITAGSPPESLHDLRKRCKELRYALEFFAPLHQPAWFGKVVGDLKRLQDCLGEFQDTDVQIREIGALAAAMLAAGEAPAATLLAMGEVTAGLVVRQRAARAAFERRFAALADVEGQRRMSALLRGRRQEGAGRYP